MARYPVPLGQTRVQIKVSNSRFIATLNRADSLAAAAEQTAAIRAEMPDATHHVYAYRIGFGASVQEALSDDGEPAGTSGPPVMAVVRGSGLGDAALVVTRYFGGTKLGTGGLVAAYQAAAKAVIEHAPRELRVDRRSAEIRVSYAMIEPLRALLRECEGLVEHEDFGELVTVQAGVALDRAEEFERRLAELSSGRALLRFV